MADPIKWDSNILLAKIESAYATDPIPTGAANGILAQNIDLKPMEGEDVSRDLERPYIGAQEEIPTGLNCVLTFETEVAGSGELGTPPGWGVLMRGCSCAETIVAETSVEYTPITDSAESLAFYMWKGTTLHKLIGSRGTFQYTLDAQGIPKLKWTFTGLYVAPSTTARATPDLTTFIEPLVAAKANTPTFTIGGATFVLRSFTFDKANDVQKRLLVNDEKIVIVGCEETVSAQIEAVPLGTYNPYSKAISREQQEIALVHGTEEGNVTSFTASQSQQKRLSGFANQQNVQEWPLMFKALPSEGNDQFSLMLT